MTNLPGTPDNINTLKAGNFGGTLSIDKLPNTAFFLQSFKLPAFTLGSVPSPMGNKKIRQPGVNLVGDALIITFRVDEDMRNWLEIYNWMKGLGFPEDPSQFREWISSENRKEIANAAQTMANMELMILKNSKKPNLHVTFFNCFPIILDGIDFTKNTGADEITVSASFEWSHLTFKYL